MTTYVQILIFYVPDDLLIKLFYQWGIWNMIIFVLCEDPVWAYSSVAEKSHLFHWRCAGVSCLPLLSFCLLPCLIISLLFAWLMVAISGFFFYFRWGKIKKEKKRVLQGRLCSQKEAGCKALPMNGDYFCFLKGKGHNKVFGLTSSFPQ